MTVNRIIVPAALAAVFLCGCNRERPLSEIEERERSSRLYSNAMDDLQAGRMDAAIKGFERVVYQEPTSYSAHFQLATLLQDVRKDYIGAICHYRNYMALRPASDKATVAEDRMKLCETLFGAEVLRKAGGNATGRFAAENEKLTAEKTALNARAVALENDLAEAKKRIEVLERENEMRKRLLAKFSEAAGAGGAPREVAAKEALAELRAMDDEDTRRKIRPSDAELLDDDSASAPLLQASSKLVKDLKAEAEREERADAGRPQTQKPDPAKVAAASGGMVSKLIDGKKKDNRPARPDTYVIQPGDTLFRISMRFYGSKEKWRAIQALNRAVIPFDGRLRVGQTIRLP